MLQCLLLNTSDEIKEMNISYVQKEANNNFIKITNSFTYFCFPSANKHLHILSSQTDSRYHLVLVHCLNPLRPPPLRQKNEFPECRNRMKKRSVNNNGLHLLYAYLHTGHDKKLAHERMNPLFLLSHVWVEEEGTSPEYPSLSAIMAIMIMPEPRAFS